VRSSWRLRADDEYAKAFPAGRCKPGSWDGGACSAGGPEGPGEVRVGCDAGKLTRLRVFLRQGERERKVRLGQIAGKRRDEADSFREPGGGAIWFLGREEDCAPRAVALRQFRQKGLGIGGGQCTVVLHRLLN
jgi:hypothetical protein